ncbi:MAG: EF-P lysine aminoacylase EpmA [Thiohalomonadaceae bacterium]
MTDWAPSATLAVLQTRARILARIRAFFHDRGVMEVETPLLSRAGATDPHIESFTTRYEGPGAPGGCTLYLHTSPEFPMKRLLAAGSGPIYQLCHVFRQGEAGRRHNPEFTLLEWYRPGFDDHALMDEVEALAREVLGETRALGPTERLSYREAFERHAGIDPLRAGEAELVAACERLGVPVVPGLEGCDAWLDLLLTHVVEPQLGRGRLCFLHDYPASQAALARLRSDARGDTVAARFELYCEGVELANGYHELLDADEQARRFAADRATRARNGLPDVPADESLIAALRHGLPDCAGVALGVDRLIMLAVGAASIEEVMAFPLERA